MMCLAPGLVSEDIQTCTADDFSVFSVSGVQQFPTMAYFSSHSYPHCSDSAASARSKANPSFLFPPIPKGE